METVDVTDLFTETKKKKLPVPLRILRACGIVLLVLVLAVAGGMCFSALNRAKALSVLPPGAALYVHTDSAWGAVNPLIDLQAADVLLSEPSLVQFRSAFMRLRTADVRKSALTAWLLARRVDAALYTAVPLEAASTASPGDGAYAGAELKTGPDAGPGSAPSAETGAERGAETSSGSEAGTSGESFVAAVDFGSLSLFTRLFTLVSPFVHIPGLELVHGSPSDYFIWTSPADAAAPDAGAAPVIYIKPLKNLVVISTSPVLFQKAISAGNEREYTEQNRALLTSRSVKKQPVRLFADASQLA
ncbi:MAG: hypothetical protein K6G80_05270 [Treponema sp.]|nr:hypothetical protein [Treponema sp.]